MERSWKIGTLALNLQAMSQKENEGTLKFLHRTQNVNFIHKHMTRLVELSFKVLLEKGTQCGVSETED